MDRYAFDVQLHVEVRPTHGFRLSGIAELLVIVLPGFSREFMSQLTYGLRVLHKVSGLIGSPLCINGDIRMESRLPLTE